MSPGVEPVVGGVLGLLSRLFDALYRAWARVVHRNAGAILVLIFLGALAVIELNRQGLLPARVSTLLTTNHFGAVGIAFTALLVVEILELVFALVYSVANSVGKQFELLSLILLRKAFLQFGEFGEPIEWAQVEEHVTVVLADIAGALVIFVLVGLFYRLQRHLPITTDEEEQSSFIAAKKAVALVLLLSFAFLATLYLRRFFGAGPVFDFFGSFYTILVFSDILIVLIALVFSSDYHVVFRNSGFAAATVVIRLALTAPDYIGVLLGVGAAILALGVSSAYNAFAPTLRQHEVV